MAAAAAAAVAPLRVTLGGASAGGRGAMVNLDTALARATAALTTARPGGGDGGGTVPDVEVHSSRRLDGASGSGLF